MKNTVKNITESPIGIFDSGLGGLSVCKEIVNLLPNESIIYLADSKNAPYGEKNKKEIIELSIKNTELLIQLDCKVIIIACNTATTNAINTLRKQFSIPFIGIEPATKLAALSTQTEKIGVLATKGTLKSELFIATSNQFRDGLEIIETQGDSLVRLIEKGQLEETKPLLEKYLHPMIKAGVDHIVLGCTHYPFLISIIKQIIPSNIAIIDSGKAVARQTKSILEQTNLLNLKPKNALYSFYSNTDITVLKKFLTLIKLKYHHLVFRKF